MKNLLFSTMLLVFAVLISGCPVGLDFPLGDPGKEKIDERLLGTWIDQSGEAEMQKLTLTKKDDYTYEVHVLEKGEMYALQVDYLDAWVTTLEGQSFLFGKPHDENDQKFYHYHYVFDGEDLIVHDVSLLEGGIDAVTSREALRKEVVASMKKPDFMSSKVVYLKD
ncbi:MAG: hypothetical protein R3D00_25550 [Bacteroidia bacterium]